jgi:UDP-3-O-[3-hydroxymyristoyl] glucosamine N-acyltransferase
MLGGILVGPDATVNRFCSLDNPRTGAVAFIERPGKVKEFAGLRPAGLIVSKPANDYKDIGQIVVDDPRLAFVKLMQFFHPPSTVERNFRHPSAVVDENAAIGEPSHIGPGCVIEAGVVMESGCRLVSNVFVGHGTRVGNDCLINPGVKILHDVRIGHRCIIGPGTVIGSDGFGFVPDGEMIHKVPQVGTVIIGDDVELGANVTVDRATIDETVIGDMTKIDNLVQVGHNVHIGKRVRIAAQCGFSGGARVGDDVVMGGQAGVTHGVQIGDRVRIAGRAGVTRYTPDDMAVSGFPAREHRRALVVEASCQRLPELFKYYNAVLKHLGEDSD